MNELSPSKKKLIYLAKIIIGVSLLYYLLINNKINFSFFVPKNAALLIQLFLLQVVMFGIGTLRWYLIGRHSCEMEISLSRTTYISWVAQFFSTFLPSTVGTDISRIFYVNRRSNVSKTNLIKITVVDRLCSLLSLVACSFLGFVFYFLNPSLLLSILSLGSVLILIGVFLEKKGTISLFKRNLSFPPFSAVALSFLNFTLKAFSIFIIIYAVVGVGGVRDYYFCLGAQLIEGLTFLPANIGVGHILFDKALGFIEVIDGAQIYNIYFSIKVLFKLTGFIGWLLMRTKLP